MSTLQDHMQSAVNSTADYRAIHSMLDAKIARDTAPLQLEVDKYKQQERELYSKRILTQVALDSIEADYRSKQVAARRVHLERVNKVRDLAEFVNWFTDADNRESGYDLSNRLLDGAVSGVQPKTPLNIMGYVFGHYYAAFVVIAINPNSPVNKYELRIIGKMLCGNNITIGKPKYNNSIRVDGAYININGFIKSSSSEKELDSYYHNNATRLLDKIKAHVVDNVGTTLAQLDIDRAALIYALGTARPDAAQTRLKNNFYTAVHNNREHIAGWLGEDIRILKDAAEHCTD